MQQKLLLVAQAHTHALFHNIINDYTGMSVTSYFILRF